MNPPNNLLAGAGSAGRSTITSPPFRLAIWLLAASLLALCGCKSEGPRSAMANAYYLNPTHDLRTLGRVALVELDSISGYPDISSDMTDALFVALQKKQIFGLMTVSQNDPGWRGLQENLDSTQGLRTLMAMRETLKCNGILIGTITQYRPYPRMVIGLRLKLLDLTNGQLLWGLEQVWDTTDGSMQKRIKRYFNDDAESAVAPLSEELVVVSTLKFCKFVAYEVAGTLNRNGP